MGSNGRAEFRVALDADYRRRLPPPPLLLPLPPLRVIERKIPPPELDRGAKPGVAVENERDGEENERAERSGKKLIWFRPESLRGRA